VLNEKLLEVLGDDVTQDQARVFESGMPTTCWSPPRAASATSSTSPAQVRSRLRGREDGDERAGLGRAWARQPPAAPPAPPRPPMPLWPARASKPAWPGVATAPAMPVPGAAGDRHGSRLHASGTAAPAGL